MVSHLISTVALVVVSSSAFAQSSQPTQRALLQRTKAPTALEYIMKEGHYIVLNHAPRSGPETIFSNSGGLYYAIAPTGDEWIDEGSFPSSGVNQTEQVNGMTFNYCSSVPDPIGDAVLTEVRLYEETIGGLGVTGWVPGNRNEKCGYVLNLPGDTSMTGLSCWSVSLNLSSGFECTLPQEQTPGSMNNFGYSINYSNATGTTATGSFIGGSTGYGVQDYFELYTYAVYQGSINFGGGPNAQANFDMSMQGLPTDTSAYYSANPGTADTVDLQGDVEVRAGQPAGWTVTNPVAGLSYALIASAAAVDIPALVGGNAHLLVDWMAAPLLPAPIVMPGGVYSQTLPATLPPSIYVQAAEYVGALTPGNVTAMSNGLKHSN